MSQTDGGCIGCVIAETSTNADVRSGCLNANSIDDGPPAEYPITDTVVTFSLSSRAEYASACHARLGSLVAAGNGVRKNPNIEGAIIRTLF